jgi:hypothetical protein
MDLLNDGERTDADRVYIDPPEGDVSDGYDMSDTEEGQSETMSRSILKVCSIAVHEK